MFPRTLARNALSQSLRGALREAAPARQHALPALARSTAPATHFAAPFSSSSRALKEDTPAKKVEEGEEKRAAEGAALGADADAAAKNGTGGEMEAALKEKDAKIKELQDQLLYGKADFQNLQRRSAEEKATTSDFAITRFARDLTSTLDILHLALRSVPEELRTGAQNLEPSDPKRALVDLYNGVELTSQGLLNTLKSHGVIQFDPTGEKFNPQEHEAMYQAPIPDKTPGTVLECSRVGYKIKDRVLRAAQVGVVQEQ